MLAWCTSGCLESYTVAVNNVQLSCSSDRAEVWSTYSSIVYNFRISVWLSKGICTSISGVYCWPKLLATTTLFSSSSSLTAQVTVAQMDTACSDACVPKVLAAVGQYGYPTAISSVKAFDVFCLKIDGAYCRVALNNWSTAYTPDASGRPSLGVLCTSW
jgi:hypothetical protein